MHLSQLSKAQSIRLFFWFFESGRTSFERRMQLHLAGKYGVCEGVAAYYKPISNGHQHDV